VSIPIHVLREGPLEVPISLNHHNGGVRVGETASWIGLGWSMSGGGVISRTILGLPDNNSQGILNQNTNYSDPLTRSEVGEGSVDGEPDLFSFHFPGGSGKFIFDGDHLTVLQFPHSNMRITVDSEDLNEFVITTTDGTRYIFGSITSSDYHGFIQTASEQSTASAILRSTGRTITEWYLRRIESFDGRYAIEYTYRDETYTAIAPSSQEWSEIYGAGPTGGFEVDRDYRGNFQVLPEIPGRTDEGVYGTVSQYEVKKCATITTSTTKVTFVKGDTRRKDLDNYNYSESTLDSTGTPLYKPDAYRLKKIRIEPISGAYFCKAFDLSHGYFTYGEDPAYTFDQRLLLRSVREVTCNSQPVNIPPYTFSYYRRPGENYDFVPWRLSKAQDAWGYYNGADGNENKVYMIPYTTLSVYADQTQIVKSFGGASRVVRPDSAKYGALRKVTYPEGGWTILDMEGHSTNTIEEDIDFVTGRAIPSLETMVSCVDSMTCCPGATEIDSVYTGIQFEQVMIDSGYWTLRLFDIGCPDDGGDPWLGRAFIKIEDAVDSTNYSELLEFESTITDSITFAIDSLFPGLDTSTTYNITVTSVLGLAEVEYRQAKIIQTNVETDVGGLRLKRSLVYNSDGSLAREKRYRYTEPGDTTASTGVLYIKPDFGAVINVSDTFSFAAFLKFQWTSTPSLPLTDLNGSHIGYQYVQEEETATGAYSLYRHRITGPDLSNLEYPLEPLEDDYDRGKLRSVVKGSLQKVVERSLHGGAAYDGDVFTSDEYIRVVKVGVTGDMTGPAYITNDFDYKSSYYRKTTDTIILDGRTSITNYFYSGTSFLPPNSIEIINSDGLITKTDQTFPGIGLTGSSSSVVSDLIDQNRIHIPMSTLVRVDGDYVSGSRSLYRFFDSNGNRTTSTSGLGPYVGDVQAFEAENYSNTINNNYWNTLGTIERIDTQTRKPHIVHQRGWTLRDTFVWDATHALLLERHFGIFDWQNEYYAGTRLFKKRTEPDGQYAQYFYDALQRLDSISVREGKVTTSYEYEYEGNIGQDHNRITTTIDFADPEEYASQSELTQRITRQYFDGLGRPTQQIEQAYTTNDKDQITITEYDAVSRPYKVYEPFEGSQSNGDPFTGSTDTLDYTLTSFEESPLNRPYQVTPPDWYATTYGYGSNASAINILGTNYAVGTLKLDTITDPNGNQQITYTDIKGRLLQQKQLSADGTTSIETRYQYDPEDRQTTILPPGSDLTDSGLIFTYQYDERDRVVEKKMPDQGAIDYVYDDRDLSTAMRDAVRLLEGKWIHTHYDEYGRAEATGFIQQGTITDGNTVYPFADSLSRTWYDGQGIGESDAIFIGRVSRQRTRVLGTNDYLDIRTWYDPYGRIDETRTNHIARLNDLSADRTTYEYDFADNILVANRDHRKPDGANLSITDEMNWDHAGRQVDHYLNIGGQRTHLSQQDYTAKDQLKEKNLGVSTLTSLQSLDYSYLPNGFLRGINHVQTESNDWFKLGIHYDQPDGTTISGFTPQYNGNIGALSWKTGSGDEQIYRYAYDYLDRLTAAQMTGNTYRTAYSYDPRGNLLTLDRYDANGTMIDDLSYIPYSGTNQIKNIFDGGTAAGFDEGDAPIFAAYSYDANGNLSHDPFKNLNIAYNHLNLPDTIIQPGSTNRIVWHYDAAGNKLRKEVLNDSIVLTGPFTENQYRARFITTDSQPTSLDSTLLIAQDSIVFKPGFHAQAGMRLTAKIDSTIVPVDSTDYIGGVEYRNGSIQAIYHPVGRAVPNGSNWRHEYVITDHLGNTRLRFSDLDGNTQIDSTEILDEITYYPFGSPWQDAGYRYTYNGKELDRELGLRWHHYGRRMFDPVIARFTGVDPISDQFAWVSTYNYAENEPIANIDLHGLQKSSFQNWVQRGLEWLGFDWNTVSKGPRNQEHAQQITENRNSWEALGEGAGAVAELQSVFIPGLSLVNPNSSGSDVGLDIATSFVPLAKIGKALKTAKVLNFSLSERKVIGEASEILASKKFSEMIESGIDADLAIGSYTINFRPTSSFSGFTSYSSNSFVIGGDAFKFDKTGEELTKTILHELYRLNHSLYKGGRHVSKGDISRAGFNSMQELLEAETRAAQNFSDDVFNSIFNN
jgi:RHS repeat-associated protein